MRILLAEDDRSLRRAIARGLREATYAVDEVGDCDSALARAQAADYDVVVLDILMPGGDGVRVCEGLRRAGSSVPVLFLTARDSVEDKIAGLDAGADDYLTKPFEFGELLARLRALTRRRGEVLPASLSVSDLSVDTARRNARRGGREIALTGKEFALLEHLVRNAGRVVSRTELAAHLWDDDHLPFSNLIDVYVSRLRRKIDDSEGAPLITTQRGLGYMLAEPMEAPASGAPNAPNASSAPNEPNMPNAPTAARAAVAGKQGASERRDRRH